LSEHFTQFKDRLFLSADDGTHGYELWSTDGTEEGTEMLVDLTPDYTTEPEDLMVLNSDHLLFTSSQTAQSGAADVWSTDGTKGGTIELAETSSSGSPFSLFTFQGIGEDRIVFKTAGEGGDIWITDGTTQGTSFLFDSEMLTEPYYPNECGSSDVYPEYMEGTIEYAYFSARNTYGYWDGPNCIYTKEDSNRLYRTDGTVDGSILLKDDLHEGISFANDRLSGKAFFLDVLDDKLWETDGTVAGTKPFFSEAVTPNVGFSILFEITHSTTFGPLLNGKLSLFVTTHDDDSGYETQLWTTDGRLLLKALRRLLLCLVSTVQ
jgi:ELWxxDGT repeat protein